MCNTPLNFITNISKRYNEPLLTDGHKTNFHKKFSKYPTVMKKTIIYLMKSDF